MTTANKSTQSTSLLIGPCRFSYLNAVKPRKVGDDPNAKEKYSVSLLIPKSDTAMYEKIKKAIEAAIVAKYGSAKPPKSLKTPLRDGDAERDDEAYAGHWFVNAATDNKPGWVNAKGEKQLLVTDNDAEPGMYVYSGMYGRASVNFYYSPRGGDKICCGLGNLQKLKEGEPLTGRKTAEEDFSDGFVFEDDDENV